MLNTFVTGTEYLQNQHFSRFLVDHIRMYSILLEEMTKATGNRIPLLTVRMGFINREKYYTGKENKNHISIHIDKHFNSIDLLKDKKNILTKLAPVRFSNEY